MPQRLTPALAERILGYLRAGGYDWVAAEAAGVPRAVFEEWLERGARRRRQPYRRFYQEVMAARAQSRLKAEIDTRDKDPRFWLRYGPGRELPDQPGWSSAVKALARTDSGNILDSPAWGRFFPFLLRALEGFPEARLTLVEGLAAFRNS